VPIAILPPGAATLELRNESTGAVVEPFDIVVDAPQSLRRPAADTNLTPSLQQ
jgi:hypothetical protein